MTIKTGFPMREMIVNLLGVTLGFFLWVTSNALAALLMAFALGLCTQLGQQTGKIVINKVKSVIIVLRKKPKKPENETISKE
jgi:hypothetical protein